MIEETFVSSFEVEDLLLQFITLSFILKVPLMTLLASSGGGK